MMTRVLQVVYGCDKCVIDDRAALRRDIRQRNDHCPLLAASCAQESKGAQTTC